MATSKEQFRIQLTPEQKAQVRTATGKDAEAVELSLEDPGQEQIRQATGKDAEAIELSVEELEERIAPMKRNNR